MIFSDLFFLYLFIALCVPLYFVSKNIAYRNAVLIVFSLIFYAWSSPAWLLLLMISVTGNYFCGLMIGKWQGTGKAKIGLICSLVLSLGMLMVFKYTDFFITNLNALLGTSIPLSGIELPIGISFYTFQILSYILDCYWGKVAVQRNYFRLLMYISLFPQLVAGPIVRYSTVETEIGARVSSAADISDGITRFIVGLGKKVVLANGLYAVTEQFLGGNLAQASVLGTWYGVIAYSLYVYFDFSGYSDMAIGLGRIFGFHFNENFNYPFISRTITEFWQRWHISLGSFFRDYLLYLPLFGKRRKYANLFLVWFCTGFWHGASWNYIIWGLYYGLFILLERLLGSKRLKKIPAAVLHLYSKLVIIVGFGIFYFTDLSRLGCFFGNLVGANGNALTDLSVQASFANNLFLILAALIFSLPVVPKLRALLQKTEAGENAVGIATVAGNVAVLLVCSLLLVENTDNPFLYWNF